MGLWKGKKGSSVFYRIKNSNNAQKQGVRERVYDPSNPKTSQQAGQRMKMLPAQRVFGVLQEVIKRAWEGVPANMVRQEYMKVALSSNTTIWPAVMKNDTIVVPGGYQISRGTLTPIECYWTPTGDAAGDFVTNIEINGGLATDATWGVYSQSILDLNPNLQDGDQITFVWCDSNASGEGFFWHTYSLNLDSESTESAVDVLPNVSNSRTYIEYASGVLALHAEDPTIWAAACIVSRDAATPKRSTAILWVHEEILPEYYASPARAAARRSYMAPERAAARDWEVEPTDGGANTIPSTYTIEGLTNAQQSIFNGEQVLVYVDDTTGELVGVGTRTGSGYDVTSQTVMEGPCVCDANGTLLTRSYSAQGEVFERNLLVSAVADLASLRQVPQV